MIISYNATTLCAGGNEQPTGYKCDVERSIQIVKPIEGEAVVPIGKGIKQTVISFSVIRSHASYDAAESFSVTHEGTLPDNGDLIVSSDTGSDTTFAAAALQKCEVTYLGETTTATYVFICGVQS